MEKVLQIPVFKFEDLSEEAQNYAESYFCLLFGPDTDKAEEAKGKHLYTEVGEVIKATPLDDMRPDDFISHVMRTAQSKNGHPNRSGRVKKFETLALANMAVAGNAIDRYKRAIYYGDPKNQEILESTGGFAEDIEYRDKVSVHPHLANMAHEEFDDNWLKHAIYGILSEAGEVAEAVLNAQSTNLFDHTNFQEELGDILWYIGYYCHKQGISFSELFLQNKAKLEARYKEKFTQEEALNRDLDTERKALEGE